MSWLFPTREEKEIKRREEFKKKFPYGTVKGVLGGQSTIKQVPKQIPPELNPEQVRAWNYLSSMISAQVKRTQDLEHGCHGDQFTWRLINQTTGLEETVKVELDYSGSNLGIRFPDIDILPFSAEHIRPVRELVARYIPGWNRWHEKPESKDFALAVAKTLWGRTFTFQVTGSTGTTSWCSAEHDTLLVWSDEITEVVIQQMVKFRKELDAIRASFPDQKAIEESFLVRDVTLTGRIVFNQGVFERTELDGLEVYSVKLKGDEELQFASDSIVEKAENIRQFKITDVDEKTLTVTVSSPEVDELVEQAVREKKDQELHAREMEESAQNGNRNLPRLNIEEGQVIEMKRSIIFSPETHQPDSTQPFNIAREIAAFMNADGGDLYLGVNNDGFVVGIDNDLKALNKAVINGAHGSDATYEYLPTKDGYRQKLENIACMMLGKFAATFVSVEFLKEQNVEYVKLHVNPSTQKFIFLGEPRLGNRQNVYVRIGQSSRIMDGEDLECYREKRFRVK